MASDVTNAKEFSSAVKHIAGRFFLPSEFALFRADSSSYKIIEKAKFVLQSGASDGAFLHFAYNLKSVETEQLLLLLAEPLSDDDLDIIYLLLKIRSGRRLCILFWYCFQFHYNEPKYKNAAAALLSNTSSTCVECNNLRFFVSGGGISDLLNSLLCSNALLGNLIRDTRLAENSPLGSAFVRLFFERCDSGGFLLNEKKFIPLVKKFGDKMPSKIISNYLDVLTIESYFHSFNEYLLNTFGPPFSSDNWAEISDSLKHKFIEWMAYRKLCMHFTQNRLKLRLISIYIPYMKDIQLYLDNTVLVIDFGVFVIVDSFQNTSFSYYLSKPFFEKVRENIQTDESYNIPRGKEIIPHGRDFIIEEAEGDFMQLDYEEIGRLYIKDMLNIILRIKPDLRPSKTIVSRKTRNRSRNQHPSIHYQA